MWLVTVLHTPKLASVYLSEQLVWGGLLLGVCRLCRPSWPLRIKNQLLTLESGTGREREAAVHQPTSKTALVLWTCHHSFSRYKQTLRGVTGLDTEENIRGNIWEMLPVGPQASICLRRIAFCINQDSGIVINSFFIFLFIFTLCVWVSYISECTCLSQGRPEDGTGCPELELLSQPVGAGNQTWVLCVRTLRH